MKLNFRKNWVRQQCLALFLLVFVSGCLNIHTQNAYRTGETLTRDAGWQPHFVETSHFTLKAFSSPKRRTKASDPLVVYIEGDGYGFITSRRLSGDPTPHNPFMLKVALEDRTYEAVYLARPCQYVIEHGKGFNCHTALWSDGRFNRVVVQDMNEAISWAKKLKNKQDVVLIGGSGGAMVAMLVAAKRNDVKGIVTLSGLINHESWTRLLKLTPLRQSENASYSAVSSVPQIHLLAEDDKVIPKNYALGEIARAKSAARKPLQGFVVPDFDHDCCWDGYWRQNYKQILGQFD